MEAALTILGLAGRQKYGAGNSKNENMCIIRHAEVLPVLVNGKL